MASPRRQDPTKPIVTQQDWEFVYALVNKFSMVTLQEMFEHASNNKRYSGGSSFSGYYSSSGSSIRSNSRTSFAPRSSISSFEMAPRQNTSSRLSHAETSNAIAASMQSPQSLSAQAGAADNRCFCAHCAELGISQPFSKKSDCKKHMVTQHYTGKEWPCPEPGCISVFNRSCDFDKHFKKTHGKPVPDVAPVELLTQTIYACGFKECSSSCDTWERHFSHITNHMEKEGRTWDQWSFTTVMNNLLWGSKVQEAWMACLTECHGEINNWPNQPWFDWDPVDSRRLRQKLECEDFRPDPVSLVRAVYLLGHPDRSIKSAYNELLLSVLELPDTKHIDSDARTPPYQTQALPPSAQSLPTRTPPIPALSQLAITSTQQFSAGQSMILDNTTYSKYGGTGSAFDHSLPGYQDIVLLDAVGTSTMCASPIIGGSVSDRQRDQLVAVPSKAQQSPQTEEHQENADQNSTLEGFPYCVDPQILKASAPTEEQRGRDKDRNTWRKKIRSLSRKRSQPLMHKDEELYPVPQLPSSHQKPTL